MDVLLFGLRQDMCLEYEVKVAAHAGDDVMPSGLSAHVRYIWEKVLYTFIIALVHV